MRDFSTRSFEPEWMDDPAVDATTLTACLSDLATVNTWTLARRPTLDWLARATAHLPKSAAFSLLDVGFGDGDMLRAIHRWAVKRGLRPHLSGLDLNPWSEVAARAATPPEMAIDYRIGDVFEAEAGNPDFIISSIVTHHMRDAEVVAFLRLIEARSKGGWFVNDLHRHWIAYYGFTALSTLMRWHPFVRHDGPLSVARSFVRADWERLIAESGVTGAEIRWRFPFRFCVGRIK